MMGGHRHHSVCKINEIVLHCAALRSIFKGLTATVAYVRCYIHRGSNSRSPREVRLGLGYNLNIILTSQSQFQLYNCASTCTSLSLEDGYGVAIASHLVLIKRVRSGEGPLNGRLNRPCWLTAHPRLSSFIRDGRVVASHRRFPTQGRSGRVHLLLL